MDISVLQNMLDQGQDSVILRFGLGNALYKSGNAAEAIPHLKAALEFDPQYSAAWKILAKSQSELGQINQAIDSYEKGMAVAEKKVTFRRLKK